jgi:aspartate racemase
MLRSANALIAAGADFFVCPANTNHLALPHITHRLQRPIIHIVDVVAREAQRRKLRRLGILGTRQLMESGLYPEFLEPYGIEAILPSSEQRAVLHHLIVEELINNIVQPAASASLQQIVGDLCSRGADGVVLGCTELPLVISEEQLCFPALDSTRLLAIAAVDMALSAGV